MFKPDHPVVKRLIHWIHSLTEPLKQVGMKNKAAFMARQRQHTWLQRRYLRLIIAGIVIAAAATAVFTAGTAFHRQQQENLAAYQIFLEDQLMGVVREAEDFDDAVTTLQQEMKSQFGMEAYIPEKRHLIETSASDEEITPQRELVRRLKAQLGIQVRATALKVDGRPLVILPGPEEAEALLDQLTEPYLDPLVQYLEIGFAEKVELVDRPADVSEIWLREEALQFLQTGTNEVKIHEVQPGESTWVIAERNGMSVEEIEAANPGLVSERLSIGQELNLIVPKPYLTVRTKEYAELAEPIPFDTEEVPSDNMYQGDRRITVQGEDGFHKIKAHIVRDNGRESDRDILEEDRLEEPVTRVVAVGTKPRPATMATGTFIAPTRGRLTSPFGMRSGRRHTGIDIAAPTGTAVRAADAGRVSFAGTQGAYGRLVIIDHENGRQTYYAHLNTISVSVGTRVHQDQQIGTVGSTGRSTGPHLHFEIRIDGIPVNPSNYVSISR